MAASKISRATRRMPGPYIAAGTVKRIHVDKRIIMQNLKSGRTDPPITVQTSRGSVKCAKVMVFGTSTMVYRPDKPLNCGARIWLETRAEVMYTR